MPKVSTYQTNFTAGEVSPKCYARVDVERYRNGAKEIYNCIVDIHGGAQRRPGLIYVASTKDSSKRSRLVPYVFSVTQAYMLEFGDFYMRVYLASDGQVLSGGSPYEISTPYSTDQVLELDFTQGADTMFIFHQGVMIQTLKRYASDRWVMKDAAFTVQPFDEIGSRFNTTLTLSSAAVGTGITATAGAAAFLDGDAGRQIESDGGIATITAFTSSTVVTVDISDAFQSTALDAEAWVLTGSPQTDVTPTVTGPVGATITLTAGTGAWRTGDEGKYITINGGLVKAVTVTTAAALAGIVVQELSATVAAPANSWAIMSSVWNDVDGYPATGALFEQRLTVAGSPTYPQTVWGSRSGLPFDFTIGTNDDDSFSFSLPSTGQINPIRRMVAEEKLVPLTYGGEFTMEGGVEKPLTPTSVRSKSPSTYGTSLVKPVRVGSTILFVQRSGRKIREFSYSLADDKYKSPDLTVLAEHITKSGVTEMAYQQEAPTDDDGENSGASGILWCVRTDGLLATLTLDRDEGVVAWTRQETDGVFESVACIPNSTGDEVWAIVRRTVGGSTVRYVERFDINYFTDCAITGTDGTGKKIWTGLDHLEGKSVAVRADGVYKGSYTVASGAITLDRNALAVEIGLPFSNHVTLLRPEVQAGDATAQGNTQRVNEVSLLLSGTVGANVNDDPISFREFGADLLDAAPATFSGFKQLGLTNWVRADEQEITISQNEPYPFHLLGVVRKITVNS